MMFIVGKKELGGTACQQSGAAGACWAHNPEVDGSKPSSAKLPSSNAQFFSPGSQAQRSMKKFRQLTDAPSSSTTSRIHCQPLPNRCKPVSVFLSPPFPFLSFSFFLFSFASWGGGTEVGNNPSSSLISKERRISSSSHSRIV